MPNAALGPTVAVSVGETMKSKPLILDLEFARADQAGDPFAFRFAPQTYLLRRAGGGFESAELSWDAALLADLEAARRPDRSPVVLQRIGELLRSFLSALGWDETERQISAAVQADRPVFLTVRSAAAELYALPFELLTLKASGQHVGELSGVLLRYEWPRTESAAATARLDGGRILFAWSAAGGAVPAQEQLFAIDKACRDGFHPFDATNDVVAHVSLSRLSTSLAAATEQGKPIAVLHLLCHGGQLGGTFGLVLDSDVAGESGVAIDAGRLRQLLTPHAATLRLVVLSACDSGNSGALGNQLGSVAQALHRAGIAAVVASRFPLSVRGSLALTETLYQELLVRPTSLERALLSVRTRLLLDATTADWASVQLYARAADGEDSRPLVFRPYRGLLSFLPEHRRFFFGRDREIAEIVGDLDALVKAKKPRLIVVAGASGTGKSSVVLAGLNRSGDDQQKAPWQLVRMRPGSAPFAALDAALAAMTDNDQPRLLVVDQFEEVFTHTADAATRQLFTQKLWALASDPKLDTRVVLTLRVDFIGRCGELPLAQGDGATSLDRIAYDETHRVFLARLGTAELRQAIEAPAHLVGLELEEGLTSRILRDIGDEPGALPLVEDTLDLLWQRRAGRVLCQAAYDELNGVTGALRGRADALIAKLDENEQRVARHLLVRLVNVGDGNRPDLATRRRVPLNKLRPEDKDASAHFERVLALLIEERLLVCESEGKERTAEVAHEALIRGWNRLQEWVREDRNLLVQLETVETWAAACKEYTTVLVGQQLGYAKQVASNHESELSENAREILRQSIAREQQKHRTRQLQLVGLGVVAVVMAGLAIFAIRSALEEKKLGEKEAAAREISEEKQKTIDRQLTENIIEQGRQFLVEQQDPLRALPYLDQATRKGKAPPALQYMLSRALTGVIAQKREFGIAERGMSRVMFRKQDSEIVAVDRVGKVRVWDLKTGAQRFEFGGWGRETGARFSADGHYVLLNPGGGMPQLWDVDTQSSFPSLRPTRPRQEIALSPSGEQVATCEEEQATLWDARKGTELAVLKGKDLYFDSAAYNADGSRVLFTSSNRNAPMVFDARTHKRLYMLQQEKIWDSIARENLPEIDGQDIGSSIQPIFWGMFGPDNKRLMTSGENGLHQWFASTGKSWWRSSDDPIDSMAFRFDSQSLVLGLSTGYVRLYKTFDGSSSTLGRHRQAVRDVSFSPDGNWLLAASADWTISVWVKMNAGYIYAGALVGHRAAVSHIAFALNSRIVATTSDDGTVRVWDLSGFSPPAEKIAKPIKRATERKLPDEIGGIRMESASGELVVTQYKNETPMVRDGATLKPLRPLTEAGNHAVKFSADGQRIIILTSVEDAQVYDARTGKLLWRGARASDWPLMPLDMTKVQELIRCRVPMELRGEQLSGVAKKPANCR